MLRYFAKGLAHESAASLDTDSEDEDENAPIDATEAATQLARALEVLDDLDDALDLQPAPGDCSRKLLKALREFQGYIALSCESGLGF